MRTLSCLNLIKILSFLIHHNKVILILTICFNGTVVKVTILILIKLWTFIVHFMWKNPAFRPILLFTVILYIERTTSDISQMLMIIWKLFNLSTFSLISSWLIFKRIVNWLKIIAHDEISDLIGFLNFLITLDRRSFLNIQLILRITGLW